MILQREKHFLPYMDGLRGLAALTVFFGHSFSSLIPNFTSGKKQIEGLSLPDLSNSSVCVFFVLSGFVLALLSTKTRESFFALVIRRYIRLAGPALISCLLSAFLLKNNLYFNQSAAVITQSYWLKKWFLLDGSYVSAWQEGSLGIFLSSYSFYNSSLWTMFVELWGSISIFSIYFAAKRDNIRLLLLLLISGLSIAFNRYDFFCLFAGAIACQLKEVLRLPQNDNFFSTAMLLLGALFCLCPNLPKPSENNTTHLFAETILSSSWFHAIGASLIIYFIHQSHSFKKLFSIDILLWLGKISFSFYLIHLLLICSLGSFIISHYYLVLPYSEIAVLTIFVCGTISLIIAYYYTKWIDSPFTHLSRFISKKIDSRIQNPIYQS